MDYRKAFQDAIMAQNNAIDPTQKKLEEQIMAPSQGASMAPTISLIDNLTGSNLASGLPKEESMKDKLGQLLQMKQAQQAQKMSGLGQLAKMQNEGEQNSMERAFKEKMYGLQLAEAKAKASKTAMGAPRKHGSEDIKAMSNIDAMMRDIPKLKAALQSGQKIVPEIFGVQLGGDNDASAARKRIKEFFGRNQSGGAIGDQEAKDFYEIISSVTDSDEMKYKKLDDLHSDMQNRRNALYYGPSATPGLSSGSSVAPSGGVDLNSMSLEDLELMNAGMGGN